MVEPITLWFVGLFAGLVLFGLLCAVMGQGLGRKRMARYQAERVIRSADALRKMAMASASHTPELSKASYKHLREVEELVSRVRAL